MSSSVIPRVVSLALLVAPTARGDEPPVVPPAELSSRVEVRNGRPTLLVNGVPEDPMFYALTDSATGERVF